MPERVQLRRTRGYRKPEGAVVVARPSAWGNPYRVGMGEHEADMPVAVVEALSDEALFRAVMLRPLDTVAAAVEFFALYAEARARVEPDWLAPLRGKDLACWCPIGSPCHADVLLELANAPAEMAP